MLSSWTQAYFISGPQTDSTYVLYGNISPARARAAQRPTPARDFIFMCSVLTSMMSSSFFVGRDATTAGQTRDFSWSPSEEARLVAQEKPSSNLTKLRLVSLCLEFPLF